MKTISTLLVLMASALGLLAQTPPAAPAAPLAANTNQEALVRMLLDRAYAEAGKTGATTRTLPTRLNAVTNAPRPLTPAALEALTAPTPATTPAPTPAAVAPATPVIDATRPAATPPSPTVFAATPAAAATTNANAAARTNRPPRTLPTMPAFPPPPVATPTAATPPPGTPAPAVPANAVATPVLPGLPNPNAPGANVNAAIAPGVADPNAAAAGRPTNPEDEVFPPGLIKFSEADLSQVLEIYQELTGRTVLKPASLPAAKISIRSQTQLTRAEAVQALDSILSMNGIAMVPQGDKFVKAVPEGTANNTGKKFDDLPWELLPESGTIVTYVVQLTNAAPQEVATVLSQFAKLPGNSILAVPSTSMLVLRDYSENVKRMMEMIQRLDVVPVQEFVDVVIPIKYALADDIAQVLSSLTAGGGSATTVGAQPTRTGISAGGGGFGANQNRGAGGLGGVGGLGGQPGYNPNNALGGQQAGGLQGGGLGSGASGRSSFAQRLNQIVNRAAGASGAGGDIFVLGQTKIIADARTNSLLIFASKADLSTISNIIDKLDVVLAQVLIEAIVLEVKVGNNLNYGFSYIQKNPTTLGNVMTGAGALNTVPFLNLGNFQNLATNAAGGLPSGFSYAASFMNFDATVQAIAGDSRINIISRPKIQTSHAVEANIFVGQTRPYVTGTYSYFGGGGPQTQFQQQQIGLTLSVLPLINSEGLVVMDIHVKVQNIGENIPIDATFSVPETIDRETAAKVAVRDRETIMLGGFISKNLSVTKSGIPILKDIPVLGALFRSTKDDQSRTELITLIRPTVLPSPKDAAIFAAEERRRLPAVRQAERDFDEDTRKRQKAEDRATEKENRKLYKDEGFKK